MLSTLSKTARVSQTRFLRLSHSAAAAKDVKPKKAPLAAVDSPSFVMNLFRGKAVTEQVFPYPLNMTEEQKETLGMVMSPLEKMLIEVNDKRRTADIPRAVLDQFAELGTFGVLVPPELEGSGFNNSQMARVAEIVGAYDLGFGVVMGAHQSIGYKGILLEGTDAQKQKYLPDLATGRKFAAFALTEPSTGSDASSVRTRAELSADGKHYVLNGGKIWISNGGFADVFTVFAQTPIKQADGSTKDKMSAFIVERAFGGVTSGPQEKKMGIKGSNTTEVHFDNVKIPVENLLGKEGEGFKVAMNILNNGRFGIPAACTGAMKHCIQKTVDHITTRVQFGKKLEEFGNVQEKLVEMISKLYATESIVYMLSSNMDRGIKEYQLEAAIGKVLASESAWLVCDDAIQVHGGMGFMRETGLERVLRDLRIFRIFEGANDVLRLFIALTGAQHAGKHLAQQASGVGGMISLAVSRVTGGNTGSNFGQVVDSSLQDSAKALDQQIALFGQTVQGLLMKHKKGIIDRQYEMHRVANAAIDIYSSAAVLSRATYVIKNKSSSADFERKIATYYVEKAMRSSHRYLKEAASGEAGTKVSTIESLAKEVCGNGGLTMQHPVEL
ncbi:Protein CBG13088 [Caenorhabditis briggsae]|uniref:Very long-chain specific acyl-CoA dehydrogenase, mitochondrial n=1 Tax=Caenorhabditis briggsae TaxID=6238 RepID=A8XH21_CAEBR|nr:Protein CBG13088 [Caenorhabditis briggsae]CAP31945.2 Protein CBG13088 [Caenorhabditis briggsae]